jgi:hypothetical protein
MDLFAKLSATQEKEFRQWARDNYIPGSHINKVWHPVVQAECHYINIEQLKGEYDLILDDDPRSDNQVIALAQEEVEEHGEDRNKNTV